VPYQIPAKLYVGLEMQELYGPPLSHVMFGGSWTSHAAGGGVARKFDVFFFSHALKREAS